MLLCHWSMLLVYSLSAFCYKCRISVNGSGTVVISLICHFQTHLRLLVCLLFCPVAHNTLPDFSESIETF
jgi:hypothetical protein